MATKYPRKKVRIINFHIEEEAREKFCIKVASEGYSVPAVLRMLVDRYINEDILFPEEKR
jgi:hypothetical protein